MKTITILLLSLASLTAFSADTPKATPYPLKTCPVSGESLGTMGKPHTFIKDGQEIKLCCKACLEDFDKDPAKYLKEIVEKASKK